jgi:triosephosphate isomerase
MRRLFIAGNWKMNLDRAQSLALAEGLVREVGSTGEVDLAVCPPFVYLEAVGQVLGGSVIKLGAQNMYCEPKGAFTGEVAGAMLSDLGCLYVILGHSERRHVFGEPDELINRKVHAALSLGLRPILCVGELLEEREAGRTQQVVRRHVESGLAGVSAESLARVAIAYEPVWAIGTGRTATPEQATTVHGFIREVVGGLYSPEAGETLTIQYGGSVKPDNAGALLGDAEIDGALVGGASLEVESFTAIVRAAVVAGPRG